MGLLQFDAPVANVMRPNLERVSWHDIYLVAAQNRPRETTACTTAIDDSMGGRYFLFFQLLSIDRKKRVNFAIQETSWQIAFGNISGQTLRTLPCFHAKCMQLQAFSSLLAVPLGP